MNLPRTSKAKKKGPSNKATREHIEEYEETRILLALESYLEKLPGLIMGFGSGGLSVHTTLTPENVQKAHIVQRQYEAIKERALLCLGKTCVPDNPDYPEGPWHVSSKVLTLLEAKPKSGEDESAVQQELDMALDDFYKAFRVYGLDFLDDPVVRIDVSMWIKAAKRGNSQYKHAMEGIFKAILWTGGGRRKERTQEERRASDRKRKQVYDKRINSATAQILKEREAVRIKCSRIRDPQTREKEIKRANKTIIEKALSSPDPAVRRAAKAIKD